MALTNFQWYVIAINVVAFLVYTIDYQIYNHGGDGIKPGFLCNLVTICGGAVGTLIAEVLWDRKSNKINLLSLSISLYAFCALWDRYTFFSSVHLPRASQPLQT